MAHDQSVFIRRADGVREYESHMGLVRQGDRCLVVPRSLGGAGSLGRSVSFAQLVATWASCSSQRFTRTTLGSGSDADHERFVSRLHGLSVAYFADRVDAADGTDIRRALLEAASPRIRAMSTRDYSTTAKGQLAELVFANGARRQFHSAVYRRAPELHERMDRELHGKLVVGPSEMNAFVVNVLRALKVVGRDVHHLAPLLKDDTPLGRLLYETFRNTAEHAYLDQDGHIPNKGMRCILIAPWRLQPNALQPSAFVSAEHPQASEYFGMLRNRRQRKKRRLIFVLELSVFDTGPGFACTIGRAKDQDDIDAVRHCFLKHASSKTGPNSGLGLGRVLLLVRELFGFVRFRTSTTEAFFSAFTRPEDGSLARLPHIVGGLPATTGTVLTIGVPLTF